MADDTAFSARYIILRDLVNELAIMGERLEEVDECIDHAHVLRECADAIQRVREHYWPLYMQARWEYGRDG